MAIVIMTWLVPLALGFPTGGTQELQKWSMGGSGNAYKKVANKQWF